MAMCGMRSERGWGLGGLWGGFVSFMPLLIQAILRGACLDFICIDDCQS